MVRLMTLEASPSTVLVQCSCGFRCVRATRAAARRECDEHRRAAHPVQAASADHKRRARGAGGR